MEFLHSKKLSGGDKEQSAQKYIDVDEIKDGVIILKNGSLRAILLVSSINFALKSTEEQDSIIAQYQGFLNSLDFPVQIVINSRRLNVTPYLEFLEKKEKEQQNELLRFQTSEYRNFIKNLTEVSNIMSKLFYIVVPFAPIESKEGGLLDKFSAAINPHQAVEGRKEIFETYKNQLWQRLDFITAGIIGTGVKVTPLKTEDIIELLYNSYNPSVYTSAIIEGIGDIELDT